MARKVIWTESAWSDVEEVADFISRDSMYYAKAFIKEIREAAGSLETLCERGRVVPEFDDKNIRELFVRNYRLIYQLSGNAVYIVGFIHGARDLWVLWDNNRNI